MVNSLKDSALRKAAERKGYKICKSRGNLLNNRGGYRIIDCNNVIVSGEKYDMTPEMVRDFLNA